MFFVVVGFVLGAPVVINTANRILEEIIIPKQELTKIKKRRAEEAAAGTPEEERRTTERVRVQGAMIINNNIKTPFAFDAEITEEEMARLEDAGILDILRRGENRRPHVARAEHKKKAEEAARSNAA